MVRRPATPLTSARPGPRRVAAVATLSVGILIAGCGGSSDEAANDEETTLTELSDDPNGSRSTDDQPNDRDQRPQPDSDQDPDQDQNSDPDPDPAGDGDQDEGGQGDPDLDSDPGAGDEPPGERPDDGDEVPFAPSGEGGEVDPTDDGAGDVTAGGPVEDGAVAPTDDSPPAATLRADDGNAAIVTIGETTYAIPAGEVNRCSNIESLIFGSFAAGGGQAVDTDQANPQSADLDVKVSFVLSVSNWEELGLQPPSINVDLVDEGVQWFAAADSGLGSVDSWQLSDGQATGRATFLGRNGAGEDIGLVTGTFEVVCR